ncbi:MAG: hypothetical protein PHE17_15430 [Thiothrix sp.]|uniref:hypothetical protein n=1 Tax=Thiothrix sp. TaxID=1032 RepID=UPI002612B8BD|nr:hypothetical protein [Thiothrix sp.]MDD5394406.1 hypothetical protein [Thiothrix sp.]
MNAEHVRQWVLEHPFSPAHIDCATAVMLKILDGKCKMDVEEKIVMALLYDEVKGCPSVILGEDIHALIETARHSHEDDEVRVFVYEKRVLAETMISRPVMKGFKGMIRAEGLFG